MNKYNFHDFQSMIELKILTTRMHKEINQNKIKINKLELILKSRELKAAQENEQQIIQLESLYTEQLKIFDPVRHKLCMELCSVLDNKHEIKPDDKKIIEEINELVRKSNILCEQIYKLEGKIPNEYLVTNNTVKRNV